MRGAAREGPVMTSYEDALAEILRNVAPLEAEEAPLLRCVGQVMVEDVRSAYDLPALDTCGPDGYAVRSEDVCGASPAAPVVLRIAGTVRAGRLPRHRLRPGEAVRVMTGSPVPQGADCVVPFESTDEPGDKNGPRAADPSEVKILRAGAPGANIRRAGSNAAKGSLVLPRGTSVGPAQISALAAMGRSTVNVVRRPVVAIVSTGDELTSLRSPLRPGRSYDCNSTAIAALVSHYGGIPRVLGIARDNEASLMAKLRRGLSADAVITSGGVSKGDYDLVRLVVAKLGAVILSRIGMGPGASFAFGLLERDATGAAAAAIPIFALSGPPVGCLTNFETLVRPALLKMLGFRQLSHPVADAVVEDGIRERKPMPFVKWARVSGRRGQDHVVLNGGDGLGSLAAMAMANCLTVIPEGTVVRRGDRLPVLPLDWTRD